MKTPRSGALNMQAKGLERMGPGSALRILLVEANLEVAARLQRLLGAASLVPGCAITLVGDLSEALACTSVEDYDVVLLDLELPDSHGLDTAITFHYAGPDLPIVVLASLTQKRLAWAAIPIWADEYFLKEDSSEASLLNIIKRAVDKHHQWRPGADPRELIRWQGFGRRPNRGATSDKQRPRAHGVMQDP